MVVDVDADVGVTSKDHVHQPEICGLRNCGLNLPQRLSSVRRPLLGKLNQGQRLLGVVNSKEYALEAIYDILFGQVDLGPKFFDHVRAIDDRLNQLVRVLTDEDLAELF